MAEMLSGKMKQPENVVQQPVQVTHPEQQRGYVPLDINKDVYEQFIAQNPTLEALAKKFDLKTL